MDEQLENRDSLRLYRRHPAELLSSILIALGMFLAGLLALLVILLTGVDPSTAGWLILFGGLYFVAVISLFFLEWILWYLDFWVLTDHQLIDAQLVGLFRRRVAELPLVQVQDVAVEQKGFLPSLFNYGHVRVQSAAKEGFFVILAVPQPQEARKIILELAERVRREEQMKPPFSGEAPAA